MALPIWIDKKVTKNSLFQYDFIGAEVDNFLGKLDMHRVEKSYFLEWVFMNIAQGFSELITKIPERIKDNEYVKAFKIYYKDILYPLQLRRKKGIHVSFRRKHVLYRYTRCRYNLKSIWSKR